MFGPHGPSLWELAEQALSSTDRGYDLLAEKFDHTPFRTPDALLDEVAPHVAEGAPLRRGLDVCTGTGAGMRLLRPLCGEVVGIDRSVGMMATARARSAAWEGEGRLAWVRGDALAMPFERAFDVAVCFGAFGHILVEDEPRFLAAIHRALVPGGRFVFVTGRMPPLSSPWWWIARGFNAAMRVRNAVIDPPFIMYYLTFLLPEIAVKLADAGFEVEVRDGALGAPFRRAAVVIATRLREG